MSEYIKLEDVQKILDTNENKYIYWETAIIEIEKQINSIPSINPEEMIEEMIEELTIEFPRWKLWYFTSQCIIEKFKELLQRFKS